MGFWHTGYIEFHEPTGLEGEFKPSPPSHSCIHCQRVYLSVDDLRKHRFEAHPLRRPVMYLDGRELGAQRVRVTRRIDASQVKVECERAVLNGSEIPVSALGSRLSAVSSDVCQIVLSKSGVEAEFELEIGVASEQDLRGIEQEFMRMASIGRLDIRAVEEFISATAPFTTAIGYCDGICAYLYGLLAKERSPESSLPYETYSAKFAKAAEELSPYDRKLARTMAGVVEFHFNHFGDAERLCPNVRLGCVAARYAAWLESPGKIHDGQRSCDDSQTRFEALVTDWETEQIVRWTHLALTDLTEKASEIELFLKRSLIEFDRVKLHILLGEVHLAMGNPKAAREHAKVLRNLSTVEGWAERMLRAAGGTNA